MPLVLSSNPGLKDLVQPCGPFEGKSSQSEEGLAAALNYYLTQSITHHNQRIFSSISRQEIVASHIALYRQILYNATPFIQDLWYKEPQPSCVE